MRLVERLKAKRQLSRAFREGLQLWADLQAGNTDVLFRLFPLLREKLQPIAAPPPGGGGELDEIKTMLEIALAKHSKDEYTMQPPALPATTGKLLSTKAFSAPVFDDDDDLPTVVIRKSEGSSAALNFLTNMASLQQ